MEPLYYESHVTIDVTDSLASLQALVDIYQFKIAKLYMDKSGTLKVSDMDMFMTAHSLSLEDLKQRMSGLVTGLDFHGFKVRRYKIEAVIIDSREYKEKR